MLGTNEVVVVGGGGGEKGPCSVQKDVLFGGGSGTIASLLFIIPFNFS